jgi:hypothetical protein
VPAAADWLGFVGGLLGGCIGGGAAYVVAHANLKAETRRWEAEVARLERAERRTQRKDASEVLGSIRMFIRTQAPEAIVATYSQREKADAVAAVGQLGDSWRALLAQLNVLAADQSSRELAHRLDSLGTEVTEMTNSTGYALLVDAPELRAELTESARTHRESAQDLVNELIDELR